MLQNEAWEQELKNATNSYRTIPTWMRQIEAKSRKISTTEKSKEDKRVDSKNETREMPFSLPHSD